MVDVDFDIPDELQRQMDELGSVDWSKIAEIAIKEKLFEYNLFSTGIKNHKITEKDVEEISTRLNHKLSDKLRQLFVIKKA